jgi:xanthine dehydrogenase accessory protein XdhC
MIQSLAPRLRELLAQGRPVVLAEVAVAKGSTPREAGAAMLVTDDATFGTIGGGRLEWEGIDRARALLAQGGVSCILELPLGPAIGQCCGGHVTLRLTKAGPAELAALVIAEEQAAASQPVVLLFGAGHVGRALAAALAPLPLRVRWIDGRAHEFPDPPVRGVETLVSDRPLGLIEAAPPGSACFVLTHSHSLDFTLCSAVLQRDDFAYLGLIGSRTKRAKFERGFRELGIPPARVARMACPIGGDALRDKRPAVIAALAAAEVLIALASPQERAQIQPKAAARAATERAA